MSSKETQRKETKKLKRMNVIKHEKESCEQILSKPKEENIEQRSKSIIIFILLPRFISFLSS